MNIRELPSLTASNVQQIGIPMMGVTSSRPPKVWGYSVCVTAGGREMHGAQDRPLRKWMGAASLREAHAHATESESEVCGCVRTRSSSCTCGIPRVLWTRSTSAGLVAEPALSLCDQAGAASPIAGPPTVDGRMHAAGRGMACCVETDARQT